MLIQDNPFADTSPPPCRGRARVGVETAEYHDSTPILTFPLQGGRNCFRSNGFGLTPAEMRHDEPIYRAEPERGIPLRIALVALVASSLLLTPILTEAAVQSAKRGHAPKTVVVGTASQSATNAAPRVVSPYAIANRQHAAESKATHPPVLQPAARRVKK
jgi:hypothetical protein